jgi:hypothetical protein
MVRSNTFDRPGPRKARNDIDATINSVGTPSIVGRTKCK